MSTSLYPFGTNEIALKWQEQYVSQAINRDFSVMAPKGVVRGFILGTSASALTVTINADPTLGDNAASLLTTTGYALGIQKMGTFSLNLASFASKTVVIALYGSYDVNQTTAADLRVYQLSPTDEFTSASEKLYLSVLGTVVVPALGTIPAANISQANRTDAWTKPAGPGTVAPKQLLRNGSFEWSNPEVSDTGSHYTNGIFHWGRTGSSVGSFVPSALNPAETGTHRNMVATYVSANGATTASLKQVLDVQARPGDALSLRLKVRCIAVPTAGTLTAILNFVDSDGNALTSASFAIPLAATDTAYRDVEHTFTVPASTARVSYIEIAAAGLTLASSGTIFYLDDLNLWFDQRSAYREAAQRDQVQSLVGSALTLLPELSAGASWATMSAALRMVLDASTAEPVLDAKRRDAGTSNHPFMTWRGRMKIGQEKTDRLTANVETPASGSSSASVNLLWASYLMSDTSGIQARLYVDLLTRALFFTINAVAQNNATLTWAKDTASFGSYKFVLGSHPNSYSIVDTTGARGNAMPLIQYRSYAATGIWIESGWEVIQSAGENRQRSTVSNTIVPEYSTYFIVTSATAQTVTLPSPTGDNTNREIFIRDKSGNAATRSITISPTTAGDIANGSTVVISTNFGVAKFLSDGTNWYAS